MFNVPKTHPVQPLRTGSTEHAAAVAKGSLATCGACFRSWDDAIPTAYTPTPSARCPFEAFHAIEKDGTSYAWDTAPDVVEIIERARRNGQRLRMFYGDRETGKAWAEENDVTGYIGRSTGAMRVPLLLHSSRSTGGDAIMTGAIVAIMTGPSRFAYKHPSFDAGTWSARGSDLPGYAAAVYHDGEVYARCRSSLAAVRLADFMRGQRMTP